MVYMNCSTFVDEAIINYADPAGDGCGWTINIQPNPVPIPVVQNVWFSPNNLAPVFQVEGLHVKLTYKFEGNGYYCGLGNTKLETITILMIEEL